MKLWHGQNSSLVGGKQSGSPVLQGVGRGGAGPKGLSAAMEVFSVSIEGFGWLRCKLPSKLREWCPEALRISFHVKSTLKKKNL